MSKALQFIEQSRGDGGAPVNNVLPSLAPNPPVILTPMVYTPGTWSSGSPVFERYESSSDGVAWATAAAMPNHNSPPTDAEFGKVLRVIESNGGVTAESAATAAVAFADAFARSDGDLGNGWDYSATKWTIASGAVIATPTFGANLVSNGTMETGDPPTGWTAGTGATLSAAADERTGGAGAQSLNAVRGSATSAATQSIGSAQRWCRVRGWVKNTDATSVSLLFGDTIAGLSTSTSWTFVTGTTNQRGVGSVALRMAGSAGQQARCDDVTLETITLADCMATRDFGTPDVRMGVEVTTNVGVAAGLVACLDSAATPANFVTAYVQRGASAAGGVVYVDKCVGGTYTRLGSGNITYSAGTLLELEYTAGVVRAFYGGVQIGIDYSASDAGILSNTRHGLFSTDALATLDDFAIEIAEP